MNGTNYLSAYKNPEDYNTRSIFTRLNVRHAYLLGYEVFAPSIILIVIDKNKLINIFPHYVTGSGIKRRLIFNFLIIITKLYSLYYKSVIDKENQLKASNSKKNANTESSPRL